MSMFNESADPNKDGFRRYQKQLALEEWDFQERSSLSGSSVIFEKIIIAAIGVLILKYLVQTVAAWVYRLMQTSFSNTDWINFFHNWTHLSWLVFAAISFLFVFVFFYAIRRLHFARTTLVAFSSIAIFGSLVWMLFS